MLSMTPYRQSDVLEVALPGLHWRERDRCLKSGCTPQQVRMAGFTFGLYPGGTSGISRRYQWSILEVPVEYPGGTSGVSRRYQ